MTAPRLCNLRTANGYTVAVLVTPDHRDAGRIASAVAKRHGKVTPAAVMDAQGICDEYGNGLIVNVWGG